MMSATPCWTGNFSRIRISDQAAHRGGRPETLDFSEKISRKASSLQEPSGFIYAKMVDILRFGD